MRMAASTQHSHAAEDLSDSFERQNGMDPNNKEYYWLKGKLEILDHAPDTDEIAVRNNYISITPIQFDLTDYKTLDAMRRAKFAATL